jgi:hypothetical protein
MADGEVQTPSDLLNKLSTALVQVSRGDPLVALRNELQTQFEAIQTRFSGIDKATELQHEDMVRVPTQVDRAVGGLRDLVSEMINTKIAIIDGKLETAVAHLNGKIEKEIGETSEKFTGVANQFSQNDKALTAALQAQEKQAIATNDSNKAASDKMEAGFSELIRQQAGILVEVRRNYDAQITAINSRLDKGEGRSSYSDPALTTEMAKLSANVASLMSNKDVGVGHKQGANDLWIVILGAIGGAGILYELLSRVGH